MVDLKTALQGLLDAFEAQNVKMEQQLNEPATQGMISEFEAYLGAELPDDVRELYFTADGQMSPYKVTYLDNAPNIIELPIALKAEEFVGNLFGGYEFLSLAQARKYHSDFMEVISDSDGGFDEFITVRDGDFVRAQYFNPLWFPIAKDGGGNAYAIDLDPPEGGHHGQLIVIGPDEDQRRALAKSVSEFFQQTAERAPFSSDDGDEQRVYFNFEHVS